MGRSIEYKNLKVRSNVLGPAPSLGGEFPCKLTEIHRGSKKRTAEEAKTKTPPSAGKKGAKRTKPDVNDTLAPTTNTVAPLKPSPPQKLLPNAKAEKRPQRNQLHLFP
jgi:hypothetical protein